MAFGTMMTETDDANVMDAIRRTDGETETALAGLDRSAMYAAGALHAEIRVAQHSIAVSTMSDAEAVRDYVTENTPLRFTGCHPEGSGHVVTFRA